MRTLAIVWALALVIGASGCAGTDKVDLGYDPAKAATVQKGVPSVAVAGVTDARRNPANWVGAIRGGMGNRISNVVSPAPMADVVKAAFADGLKARNLLAADGRHAMTLSLVEFDGNHVFRARVGAKVGVSVVDRTTGKTVFTQSYAADRYTSQVPPDTPTAKKVEDLRAMANAALQEVVDHALDDPRLRAALAQ